MDHQQPSEEAMDEAAEESFPASDPPAWSSPTEDRGPERAKDDEDAGEGEKRPPSDS